jgi:surfactin synthase thioesterase subunit
LEGRRELTSGPFERYMFPGEHFYLVSEKRRFFDLLASLLAKYV